MSVTLARPRRRATALLATALCGGAALVATTPALAGSYEQVSRSTGAQGFAPLGAGGQGIGVGDNGRYSVLSGVSANAPGAPAVTLVRDIVGNTTTQLAKTGDQPLGFDRTETKLLVKRGGGLVIVPTSGVGAERVIATGSGAAVSSATISGDGATVAFSREGQSGVTLVTVASGATRQVTTGIEVSLGSRSLSDNGAVLVAGTELITASRRVQLDATGIVSPDGRTVVNLARNDEGYFQGIQITTVSTGAQRKVGAGVADSWGEIAWIAPDGTKAYVAYDAEQGIKVLNTTTGAWSTLATPYHRHLQGINAVNRDYGSGTFSRNGKYALVPFGVTVSRNWAVVDVAGADLPGDQEPISATGYVFSSAPTLDCDKQTVHISLADPGLGITPARSANISVSADGRTIAKNRPLKQWGDETDTGIQLPLGTKSFTFQLYVVDGRGAVLSHRETFTPIIFPWCGGDL